VSEIVRARVTDAMQRLRLRSAADRLDAVLTDAARKEPTYLDFLDGILREELDAKQKRRLTMGIKIAHFPVVKTLEEFDFEFQPSLDARLVRELATGHFIAQAENVLLLGPPGVGKTHVGISLGRAAIEAGHSVLFVTATALLAALSKAHAEGHFGDQLTFFAKPKLLIIDELATCRLSAPRRICSFSSWPSATSAGASCSRPISRSPNGATSSATRLSLPRSSTGSCITATSSPSKERVID